MRAVVLEVDERMIAERHRLGQDKRDEMWKGVLHMVPPASLRHQNLQRELLLALASSVRRLGLRINTETGVFASATDYRVPDMVVFDDVSTSERGIDGAPRLVVEIRSPGDETYEKIPWYLERGTEEVFVVDRDALGLELWRSSGEATGGVEDSLHLEHLETLGVTVSRSGETLLVDGRPLDL